MKMNDEYMTVQRYRGPQEALDEIARELNVRSRCFPKWIADGRVCKTDAYDRLDRLASAHQLILMLLEDDPHAQIATLIARYQCDYVGNGRVTSSGDKTAPEQ